MRIEVFADIVRPFTHVGLRRLADERLRRGTKTPVVVHAWPLEWVNGHPLDRDLIAAEIGALRESVAPDLFKGFDRGAWPGTSIPAFGLVAGAAVRRDFECGRNRLVRGSPHFFIGDRDWFCPSLHVSHRATKFDIEVAEETLREFYEAASA